MNRRGCGCCEDGTYECQTSIDLHTASDWSGSVLESGGWLTISSSVVPVSTMSGAEAYILRFYVRNGSLTVTIDGRNFVIDTTAGTLTAHTTSTPIRPEADSSTYAAETFVEIHATPTHTRLTASANSDYGTTYIIRTGAMLTHDRTSTPSGLFTLNGNCDFRSLTISDATVQLVDDTLLICDQPNEVPRIHRCALSCLQQDGATFLPLRNRDFSGSTPTGGAFPAFWFPNLDFTNSGESHTISSGSQTLGNYEFTCNRAITATGFTSDAHFFAEAEARSLEVLNGTTFLSGIFTCWGRTSDPGSVSPTHAEYTTTGYDSTLVSATQGTGTDAMCFWQDVKRQTIASHDGTLETITPPEVVETHFCYGINNGLFADGESMQKFYDGNAYYISPSPLSGSLALRYPKPSVYAYLRETAPNAETVEHDDEVNSIASGLTLDSSNATWSW